MSELAEISYAEALRTILAAVEPLLSHEVPIEAALGYALAEDVTADLDLPAFESSAMDGYAVRSADTAEASADRPVQLRLVGSSFPGQWPRGALGPGEATSIGTGGVLPAQGDAIVRIEDAQLAGAFVLVRTPVAEGRDIRHIGEDVRLGATVLSRGQSIGPTEIAVLAGVRLDSTVKVTARPSVAILTVGDELVGPGVPLKGGRTRNVNLPALLAQATEAGCIAFPLDAARDDMDEIEDRIGEGATADALVVTGGVSMGQRDFTRDVISRLGAIQSWRIRMRPVRPFGFGRIGGTPVLALPGNPVAAMVAFELLVRPALRKLAGHARTDRPTLIATAAEPIENRGGTLNFVRAVLYEADGIPVVHASIPQGTHVLRSLALANCLVEVPEGTERVEQGAPVRVRLLSGEG